MSWVKKVRPEHRCVTPNKVNWKRIASGSIWACKCGKEWLLKGAWLGYPTWVDLALEAQHNSEGAVKSARGET